MKNYHSTLIALDLGPKLRDTLEAVCERGRVSKADFVRAAIRDAIEQTSDPYFRLEVLHQFLSSVIVIVDAAANKSLISSDSYRAAKSTLLHLRGEVESKQAELQAKPERVEADTKENFPDRMDVESVKRSHLVDDILHGVYKVEDFFTGEHWAEDTADLEWRRREIEIVEKGKRRRELKKAR